MEESDDHFCIGPIGPIGHLNVYLLFAIKPGDLSVVFTAIEGVVPLKM